MQFFNSSDGKSIAYQIDDYTDPWVNPDTMILLHPAMGTSERFFSWMPRLVREFRVVRMDLRGHGSSEIPKADEALTLARIVQDVVELMDAIGCDRAHFVGNSAGGYVSQRMAIEKPERVISLALYGSTPGLKNSGAKGWLPQVEEKGLRGFIAETVADRFPVGACDPGLIDWYLDQIAENDTAYIGRFISLMADQEWSHEVRAISCPTLVVIPGGGKVSPRSAYAAMESDIRDVHVIAYDDAPHTVCDFMPERCLNDLLQFLSSRGLRQAGVINA